MRSANRRRTASQSSRSNGRRASFRAEPLESRQLLSDTCGCLAHGTEPLTTTTIVDPPTAPEAAAPELTSAAQPADLTAAAITPQASSFDSSTTTPTGWLWYHGVDSAFLQARADDGWRMVDIEVESTDPNRYTAAFVRNTGAYAKGWWWYFGLTTAQVGTFLDTNNARLVDIESYVTGGQRRYAVIMNSNTGADQKAWWWYVNATPAQIADATAANNARLVDIDQHTGGANRTFDVIMISNTGADAAGWWYYYNATPAQINAALSANQARPVDVEAVDSGHFDVVMERTPVSGWWWYYGQTEAGVNARLSQNGARPFHVEPYFVGAQKFFAVLMVNNSNEVESRVGEILRDASATAETGLYLKRVGGPVLAGLQENHQFEPASMIKALLNLVAMRAVQAGTAALTDPLWMYYNPANPFVSFNSPGNPDECPDSYSETTTNRVSLTLQQTLEYMMERSDNRATETIDDRFGRAAIEAVADLAGMASTDFASRLGCGVPGNFLTLADAGRMYEGVLNNTLLNAANEATFFRVMTDDNGSDTEQVPFGEGVFAPFQAVVREEAADRLNRPQNDPLVVALANAFIAEMRGAWKGGGYTIPAPGNNWNEIRTAGGYVGLPFRNAPGVSTVVNYVYGIYIEGAIAPQSNPTPVRNAISAAWNDSQAELLRNEIRAALNTWRVNPGISINNVSVTEGDTGTTNLTFTATLSGSGSDLPVRVNYATSPGTAVAPADFTSENGIITFTPGQTSRSITIAVRGDTLDENNETFSVILSSPELGTIQDGTGVGTIIDDDAPPTISVQDFRLAEGNAGNTPFNFTVVLSAPSSKVISVTATTAPGTATAPADYTHGTTQLTFNPGETSKTFTVLVNGELAVEADEQFFVNLSAPTNATIGDGQGTGTILNDDQSLVPPVVRQVYLSGGGWAQAFKDYLETPLAVGDSDYGFAIPGGAGQLLTMPWTNADRISIQFDQDVVVHADDLVLRNSNPGATYTLDPLQFSYDAATRTATWALFGRTFFRNDRFILDLNADAPNGVRNAAGTYLDGNWNNDGSDAYPSGNGTPGEDFLFRFNMLPGDADRAFNRVNAADQGFVKARLNRSTTSPNSPIPGGASYSVFADVTGDGRINAADQGAVKARLNTGLPAALPLASFGKDRITDSNDLSDLLA